MATIPDKITRLKAQLLSSGLQSKDNPLWQVINQLIDAISESFTAISSTSGSGGGTVGPQGPQGISGMLGIDGIDGEPGPMGQQGLTGATGATGATGSAGAAGLSGIDGLDGDSFESFHALPTITQLLDLIASNPAQGSVLFRGINAWQLLAPSSVVGYFLQSAGVSANPVWAGPGAGPSSPFAIGYQFDYWADLSSTASVRNTYGQVGTVTDATGTATRQTKGNQPYLNITTLASTNSTSSFTGATSGTIRDLDYAWDFDLSFAIRTDDSVVTSVRYMIGTGVNIENADTVTASTICFRYSTAAGDGGWVGVTYNGSQSVTGTVAAIAANTAYVLRIRKVSGTVFFSVNGGTEVSTSTQVPTTTPARIFGRTTALANSARSMFFSRSWCLVG